MQRRENPYTVGFGRIHRKPHDRISVFVSTWSTVSPVLGSMSMAYPGAVPPTLLIEHRCIVTLSAFVTEMPCLRPLSKVQFSIRIFLELPPT